MPMSGPTLTAKILGAFTAAGFIGTSSPLLAAAIGNGSMLVIIGASFTTTDGPGTDGGTGIGAGVGLTGVVAPVVSSEIQIGIISFTGLPPTPDMISMADAIGDGFAAEVLLAGLASIHAPVLAGPAVLDVGSITPLGSVGDSIELAAPTFLGSEWPDFADVYGTALENSLALASGAIIIGGGGGNPVPSGTGSGVLS